MKRDIELIRAILLKSEEQPPDKLLYSTNIHVEGFDSATIDGHILLLEEAGLIEVQKAQTANDSPYSIKRLTWDGHDFVSNAKNPSVWKKFRTTLKEKGGTVAWAVMLDLLKQIAKQIVLG
jgi:hypothetical protein